jgi:hypothetical protein
MSEMADRRGNADLGNKDSGVVRTVLYQHFYTITNNAPGAN